MFNVMTDLEFSDDDYHTTDDDAHMLAGNDLEVGKIYQKTMDYKLLVSDSTASYPGLSTNNRYLSMNEPFMVIETNNQNYVKCIGVRDQFMGYAWFNTGLRQFMEVKEEGESD